MIFSSVVPASVGAKQGQKNSPEDIHHQSVSDCNACHSEFNQESLSSQKKKCSQCHDMPSWEGAESKLLDKPRTQVHYPDNNTQRILLFELYYEATKRGLKPQTMRRIPQGEFIMGSDARLPDEGPEHSETLNEYWIDTYEVTNGQYKQFIDDTARRSPDHFRNRTYPKGKVDHPVTFVTWFDANAYCQWAGKRLPTQQEWEKAARGTDGKTFPWGNEFSINAANTPLRWSALKKDGDTSPVGSFAAGKSPYGLYDMSGNVWEWTASWYQPYANSSWQSENYGEKYKVLKGGSWWDCSFYHCGISAPVFNRSFFQKRTKNASFGFRCAASHPQH